MSRLTAVSTVVVGYLTLWLIAVVFWLLWFCGRIRIRHRERFPRDPKNLLIVSNHPSLWEVLILPGLFAPRCLFTPRQYAPWNTPDTKNARRWGLWLLEHWRNIYFPRGDRRGCYRAFKRLLAVLKKGQSVIFFPEGGRTSSAAPAETVLESPRYHKRLRSFDNAVGRALAATCCTAVCIWIDGADKVLPRGRAVPRLWCPINITIGLPRRFCLGRLPRDQQRRWARDLTAELEQELLALADEIPSL